MHSGPDMMSCMFLLAVPLLCKSDQCPPQFSQLHTARKSQECLEILLLSVIQFTWHFHWNQDMQIHPAISGFAEDHRGHAEQRACGRACLMGECQICSDGVGKGEREDVEECAQIDSTILLRLEHTVHDFQGHSVPSKGCTAQLSVLPLNMYILCSTRLGLVSSQSPPCLILILPIAVDVVNLAPAIEAASTVPAPLCRFARQEWHKGVALRMWSEVGIAAV